MLSSLSSSSSTINTEHGKIDVKNVRFVPLEQLTHKLHDLLQNDQPETIGVEGYVTHRRVFGSSLAFVDLIQGENLSQSHTTTNDAMSPPTSLQVLIKRQTYDHSRTKSSFASLLKSIYPGMKLYMEGQASPTDNEGQVVFMVEYIQVVGLSRDPHHLRGILQRIRLDDDEGNVERKEDVRVIDDKERGMVEERKIGLSLEDFHSCLQVGNDIQKMRLLKQGKTHISWPINGVQ